jgi:hypothetical protein
MAWYGHCVAQLDAIPALAPFMKLVSDQLAEFSASCAAESNVALNKPTTLNGGPYTNKKQNIAFKAEYCVDGITDEYIDTNDPGYRCDSSSGEPFGWLIIDLGQPYTVDTVEIYNRGQHNQDGANHIKGGAVRLCGKAPKLPPFCTDDTQLAGMKITTKEDLYILDNHPAQSGGARSTLGASGRRPSQTIEPPTGQGLGQVTGEKSRCQGINQVLRVHVTTRCARAQFVLARALHLMQSTTSSSI